MDKYKHKDNGEIVYSTVNDSDEEEIIYDKRVLVGGARQTVELENEITYPLSVLEYNIIREQIPSTMLNSNQSFFLSTGISFLVSSIVYAITTPLSIKAANGIEQIKWVSVFFLVLFVSASGSTLLAFIFDYFFKKKPVNTFDYVEKKIKTILGIE